MALVLLAGLVGALLVFVWGLLRERWRNYLEQEGLARVLLGEVEHNEEVVRTIGERTCDLPAVRSEAWREWTPAAPRVAEVLVRDEGAA